MNLDDVFEAKEEIAGNIKEELSKAMSGYGFSILHALVTDIEPAIKVKEAMNEINAARRHRVAAAEKAEADKVTRVKAAEAEAESKFLQGQGMARQRQAIISGLRDSVQDFSSAIPGIQSKDVSDAFRALAPGYVSSCSFHPVFLFVQVLDLMLITQYFDTLREIGATNKTSTLFLPHNPAGMGEISSQIRSAFLQGNAVDQMNK